MALLSFQAHCKLRCAVGVVLGLQLLLVPESFAHAFGMTRDMDALCWDLLRFAATVVLTMAALYWVAASVTDARFQRGLCCTEATHILVWTLLRFTRWLPAFGATSTISNCVADWLFSINVFALLRDGFVVSPAPPGVGPFRWLCLLWGAAAMVFGAMAVLSPTAAFDSYIEPELHTHPAFAALMSMVGTWYLIPLPGFLCLFSATHEETVRVRVTTVMVCSFAGLVAYRFLFQLGLLFPMHAALVASTGTSHEMIQQYLLTDTVLYLPWVLLFFYSQVLGRATGAKPGPTE